MNREFQIWVHVAFVVCGIGAGMFIARLIVGQPLLNCRPQAAQEAWCQHCDHCMRARHQELLDEITNEPQGDATR
jgi:hypothetical protein